jgi:hypothetical protein
VNRLDDNGAARRLNASVEHERPSNRVNLLTSSDLEFGFALGIRQA